MKIIIGLLAMSMALAVAVEPGFDPKDIVRQLREPRGGKEPACHSERRRSSPESSVDGGEFLIDTSVTYIPVPGNQGVPAVAFDGTNFLMVWDDHRSSDCDIFAARVTPAGRVLDSMGIPVAFAEKDQSGAAVAFDGTNFLVVWEDCAGAYNVYGARVTPAGVVLDPMGFAISSRASRPALAFDGDNFLVVWEDHRNGDRTDIYGARVSQAGVVFDSGPVVRQEGAKASPALARGVGSQMFLVYRGWAGTVGGRIYNTQRIWGKMNPSTGIEECSKPRAPSHNLKATVVRELPAGVVAFDAMGRRAVNPKSGVYFVREEPEASGHQPQTIRKVVIQH